MTAKQTSFLPQISENLICKKCNLWNEGNARFFLMRLKKHIFF